MKTKLLFSFLLFSGMYQFTSAFNTSTENCDEITESSTFLTLDSFTITDDTSDITITINGSTIAATYRLYIDTDNSAATGYTGGEVTGADFLIENGAVNRYDNSGSNWVWEWHQGNVVETVNSGVSLQLTIDRTYLPLLNSGSQINVSFTNIDAITFEAVDNPLPLTGMESYTTTTAVPAPDLSSLTITEDATTLTLTILGANIDAAYDVFIDTDNNAATGISWQGGGDILLQGGLSYDSTGTGWNWSQHPTTAINSVTDVAGVSRVMVLDRAILGIAVSNIPINVIYTQSSQTLAAVNYITLSVDNLALDNVSIYKTNSSTLTISSSIQGKSSLKLFDMLGKQVLNSSFSLNGTQDISLPNLTKGIYIVQLKTETGTLSKKIIL